MRSESKLPSILKCASLSNSNPSLAVRLPRNDGRAQTENSTGMSHLLTNKDAHSILHWILI